MLYTPQSRNGLRTLLFSSRSVNPWNALLEDVVTAISLTVFRVGLDARGVSKPQLTAPTILVTSL